MKEISSEDLGTTVFCDFCGVDYSFRGDVGGMIFETKAVCPECTDGCMPSIRSYKEEKYIRAICPNNLSFWAFVVNYRGDNNKIKIYGF